MLKNIIIANETDEERRARIYPIILSEYNPAWTEWYAEEKVNLERLIGKDNIVRISHYGSTSVPGLTAKPTVDILLEIAETVDIEELIALMPNEYITLRREGNSLSEHDLIMIIKGYTDTGFADKVYHIHVRNPGDWDELYFRDYLIVHPETAAEYAELKRRLLKDYEHDRDGYTAAKGEFVQRITSLARVENSIKNVLTGEMRKNAADFFDYLIESGMQFERGKGYWVDKLYWMVKYKGGYICYILFNSDENGQWVIWLDGSGSNLYAYALMDKNLKEIAWKHVDICGNCGDCKNPGGNRKTIFGKEFDNVCVTPMRFDNPDAETIECVKQLIDIRCGFFR